MTDGRVLSVITNDTIEERGQYNLESGERLYARGEIEKSFTVNMISAREGFAPCQNNIGYAYEYGEGVSQNLSEAVRWYRLAADQNNRDGQYNLSQSLLQGTGVEIDQEEGMKYLIKAANNNHPAALHNLGCKLDRDGNCEQAFECYKKAAELGYASAQHNLAICYLNGDGTQCNQSKAIYWFKIAASNGVEASINILRDNGIV